MSRAPEHEMPGSREAAPDILNDSNSWTFNSQRYYINVQLHNTASNIAIPPSSIVSLSFTESIYSIFPSIELVIDTSSNIIDNMVQGINDDLRQRVFYDAFNFNSDGRETFLITMSPIGENNTIVTDVDQKYLICGYDKETAKYIATDQNQSPRYDCRLVEEKESDPIDTEVNAKEGVFTKAENGKYFWKEIE